MICSSSARLLLRPRGRLVPAPSLLAAPLPTSARPPRPFSTTARTHTPLFSGASSAGLTSTQSDVRDAIQTLCAQFPDAYWLARDQTHTYPYELYDALVAGKWPGIALPAEYGGAGLGISEATVMLQTIAESGAAIAGAQSVHANVYPAMPLVEFGSDAQKRAWIPQVVEGRMRLCFGVTEAGVGSETLKIRTRARRVGDEYVVDGGKVWTSSAQVASHCVLLVRTAEPDPQHRSRGLSLLLAPLRRRPNVPGTSEEDARLLPGVEMRRIAKMGGNTVDANEVFYDGFRVPAANLIGEEGRGFSYVLHGMNAERCLLAGEAIGTGFLALKKAVQYASERVVFDRPIGAMQAIQHPLAKAWTGLEAARQLTIGAARAYDTREPDAGALANAAKYVAAEAGYAACETAVLTLGGMGYAKEYHVERYLREILVPRLAPVSREMILNYLGQRVLGLPKSY